MIALKILESPLDRTRQREELRRNLEKIEEKFEEAVQKINNLIKKWRI